MEQMLKQGLLTELKSKEKVVCILIEKVVYVPVYNGPKIKQKNLKLYWEGIESAQNMRDLCYQCGRPCGKTISSEYTCELMLELKKLASIENNENQNVFDEG